MGKSLRVYQEYDEGWTYPSTDGSTDHPMLNGAYIPGANAEILIRSTQGKSFPRETLATRISEVLVPGFTELGGVVVGIVHLRGNEYALKNSSNIIAIQNKNEDNGHRLVEQFV